MRTFPLVALSIALASACAGCGSRPAVAVDPDAGPDWREPPPPPPPDFGRDTVKPDAPVLDIGPPSGDWPKPCGQGPAPAASSCGAGAPCKVLRDDIVAQGASPFDRRPALALDGKTPHVLFSKVSGAMAAMHATVDGKGGWLLHKIRTTYSGHALSAQGGALLALLNSRTGGGAELYQRGASKLWSLVAAVPFGTTSMRRDRGGCVHAPLFDETGKRVLVGKLALGGKWQLGTVEPTDKYHPNAQDIQMALAPSGEPHFVYWYSTHSVQQGWQLVWRHDSGRVVRPLGSNVLGQSDLAFAVSGTPATPHVLYFDVKGQLTYLHGSKLTPAVVASNSGGSRCNYQPSTDGETCAVDYLSAHIEDVVVAGGKARLLYSQRRHAGTLTASCFGGFPSGGGQGTPFRRYTSADAAPPMPSCQWNGETKVSGSLHVATPLSSGGFTKSPALLDGSYPAYSYYRASARADSDGRIHLAIYQGAPTQNTVDVRYIVIGN